MTVIRIFAFIAFLFFGCSISEDNKKTSFQLDDTYVQYLPLSVPDSAEIQDATALQDTSYRTKFNFLELQSKVALLTKLFEQTGNVTYLNTAVSIQEDIVDEVAIKKEKYLRSLAQLYIKQHRFAAADSIIQVSRSISDSRQNKYVLFDIAMERGRFEEAAGLIKQLVKDNDVNYLIRLAKWKDYKGDLGQTIQLMQEARDLVEATADKDQLSWMYSNLGDYYGHDNQLDSSYHFYLKTLELDSDNQYVLRKIAYMLYAHQQDYDAAIALLDQIQIVNVSPDIDLLKAEIHAVADQAERSEQAMQQFLNKVNTKPYGAMYNGYLIEHYSGEGKGAEAISLAQQELKNRKTPETYAWLAASQLAAQDEELALQTIEDKVIGKTFEPAALLIAAKVYAANDKTPKVASIKEELQGAAFELGPATMIEVNAL